MDKLEACPFCGKDDKVRTFNSGLGCYHCGATAPKSVWNRRAVSPRQAKMEAVVKEVETIVSCFEGGNGRNMGCMSEHLKTLCDKYAALQDPSPRAAQEAKLKDSVVEAAYKFHDHYDECEECQDGEGQCEVANDLWHAERHALAALQAHR